MKVMFASADKTIYVYTLSVYYFIKERKNRRRCCISAVARGVNDYLIQPRPKLLFTSRADWRLCNDRGNFNLRSIKNIHELRAVIVPDRAEEHELDGFNRIAAESSEDCTQSTLLKDAIFASNPGFKYRRSHD